MNFCGRPLMIWFFFCPRKSEHGQPDRHVAADEAAAFDQPDLQAVLGRGQRGGEPGRAAADDEHVVFGADGNGPRRLLDYVECHFAS